MKTSSAKAKGARLCKHLRDELLTWAPDLLPDDILVTSSGANGEDLRLSPRAREIYPMSFECANQESLNVWKKFSQAEENCGPHIPVLCFGRNRSVPMVALRLSDFLKLVR